MRHSGLARIVSQPAAREYHLAQFLGDEPPTVPAILTSDLRTTLKKQADGNGETRAANR